MLAVIVIDANFLKNIFAYQKHDDNRKTMKLLIFFDKDNGFKVVIGHRDKSIELSSQYPEYLEYLHRVLRVLRVLT